MTNNSEEKKDTYHENREIAGKEDVQDVVELENAPEKELPQKSVDHQKIRKQIENTLLDDDVKMQAQTHATDLQSLEVKEKIEKLLQVAKEKGVVFAIAIAKKMNDPYILDTLHDTLANEGYYKEFLK